MKKVRNKIVRIKNERRKLEIMSENKSHDVKIMYTDDDLAKVQTKTNLYVQKYGDLGVCSIYLRK